MSALSELVALIEAEVEKRESYTTIELAQKLEASYPDFVTNWMEPPQRSAPHIRASEDRGGRQASDRGSAMPRPGHRAPSSAAIAPTSGGHGAPAVAGATPAEGVPSPRLIDFFVAAAVGGSIRW